MTLAGKHPSVVEVYSNPRQTSTKELFAKTINTSLSLTIFVKNFIKAFQMFDWALKSPLNSYCELNEMRVHIFPC